MSHLEGNWHHDLSGERRTARARPAPGAFWKPPFPAPKLFWAIVGTQVFAVLMCAFGWGVPALPWILIGLVWAYNLVWMIVQDVVKLGIYWELNARAANQTPFLKHLKAVVHPHGALHQH
jgi:H+-transporting ATPase